MDGTYELFRHFYGAPRRSNERGAERGAVRSALASLLAMLERGATHAAVATDHVVESFRNDLWSGYKTSTGIPPELHAQFGPLEDALRALGLVVWPMEELEADDGLASGAALAARDRRVGTVYVCTPDKDLAQCVAGDRVVQLDRRTGAVRNEQAVLDKFGVPPSGIPDYLALVGDAADGFPGLPGWGPKSAAAAIRRYKTIEEIPGRAGAWDVPVRGAARLASALEDGRARALLFRDLATLRDGVPLFRDVEELRWTGPTPALRETAAELGAPQLWQRAAQLAEARLASGERAGQPSRPGEAQAAQAGEARLASGNPARQRRPAPAAQSAGEA